ncbi:hypothetical protein BJ138DRAFT_1019737 [Hygrophoropsis aurantiaca]|uniref:Uncharacterized protein n=1 Tax=Hygrophoropsis aurantiaca TaxID=72124 RepID=A0ACB7ZTH8_9AGAM|nr:hypothetical protein BJ138DRAFT_1019737 [Hygrophoropsis aurantiaca]
MVTENAAISCKVVNGAEGTLQDIVYEEDDQGHRYAVCAYVHIPGSGINAPGLDQDVVPILPSSASFQYKSPSGIRFTINRKQLPLLPAYAFTDFKAQGKTFSKVILDVSSARFLQNAYVMLSRATSLKNMAILRLFGSKVIHSDLSAEFREEFSRLRELDERTRVRFEQRDTSTFPTVCKIMLRQM